MGWFWGRVRVQMLFWGLHIQLNNFHFLWFLQLFWIWLNFWVIFDFLEPYWAIFGVRIKFKKFFGVYSCSWTTFNFYTYFDFNFWGWLDFGVIFLFFGALMGWFWGWVRLQILFWGLLIKFNNFHFLYFLQF